MSKIQDALKKLQSADRQAADEKSNQDADVRRLASITSTNRTLELDGAGVYGAEVTVDYDTLRKYGFLAPSSQQRYIADQYRLIKRPLLDNVAGRNAHVSDDANLIMITSALPGDGKTFNCINLALSMATEKDLSVLLVDADVAKPHISGLFGIDAEPGLIDALVNSNQEVEELILPTNVPGLSMLPAGREDDHATELLASDRMAAVVSTLSHSHKNRVVIFDSPPLLATSEARVLGSRMGQIVLVVRSGSTPQSAVHEAIDALSAEKAVSIVLNQAPRGFGGSSYGAYGYGYGHSRESSEKE